MQNEFLLCNLFENEAIAFSGSSLCNQILK